MRDSVWFKLCQVGLTSSLTSFDYDVDETVYTNKRQIQLPELSRFATNLLSLLNTLTRGNRLQRILFRPETCLEMGLANDATRLRTASVRQDQRQYCVRVLRTHPVGSVVLRTFNSHPHYLLERTQNMLERWDGTSDTEVSSSGRRGEHEHRS